MHAHTEAYVQYAQARDTVQAEATESQVGIVMLIVRNARPVLTCRVFCIANYTDYALYIYIYIYSVH